MKNHFTGPALDIWNRIAHPSPPDDAASPIPQLRTRLMVALVAALGMLTLTTLNAPTAQAHDTLISSNPTAGSTVDQVPTTVALTFDQPGIGVGSIMVVTGPSGDARAGELRLVDRTVSQDLTAGSPAGEYKVVWRITSADGHPVSGQFTFTAAHPSTGAHPASSPGPPGPAAALSTPANATAPASTGPPLWVIAGLALVAVISVGLAINLLNRRRRRR